MNVTEIKGLRIKHIGKRCTEVKMNYLRPREQQRLARAWPSIAPMLEDDLPDEPNIEELKRHPEMIKFLLRWGGEEKFTVFLRSEEDENVQKAVLLVDDKGRACAVAIWEKDTGSSFFVMQ